MKDGGQAFPSEEVFDERVVGMHPGMTIRQFYKAAALQGLLANADHMADIEGTKEAAEHAAFYADAMIAEDAQHEKEA